MKVSRIAPVQNWIEPLLCTPLHSQDFRLLRHSRTKYLNHDSSFIHVRRNDIHSWSDKKWTCFVFNAMVYLHIGIQHMWLWAYLQAIWMLGNSFEEWLQELEEYKKPRHIDDISITASVVVGNKAIMMENKHLLVGVLGAFLLTTVDEQAKFASKTCIAFLIFSTIYKYFYASRVFFLRNRERSILAIQHVWWTLSMHFFETLKWKRHGIHIAIRYVQLLKPPRSVIDLPTSNSQRELTHSIQYVLFFDQTNFFYYVFIFPIIKQYSIAVVGQKPNLSSSTTTMILFIDFSL